MTQEEKKLKIPITKPTFGNTEREHLLKPLKSGWVAQGPFVSQFEKLFVDFSGVRFAIAVSNCTTALHLALEVLGITRGDKVIVPSFTYVASANSVECAGAEVVFCDIDLATFNIDIEQVAEILKKDRRKRIKAIMPVNLFGLCADLPKITQLAKIHNLGVVEDSACGLGAYIGNKHSGTFGDIGCFSFHPRKAITTGEGGMLITNDGGIAKKVTALRNHGAALSDLQRHKKGGSLLPAFNVRGYNYRMTDLQGALGVAQMEKVRYLLEKRKKIAERYDEALKNISTLITPHVLPGYIHGYQSYVCMFTGGTDVATISAKQIHKLNIERNNFMNRLEEEGIGARQGTHAVHTLGYYKKKGNVKNEDYIHSYAADRLSVALPVYADMTDEEFGYVVTRIKKILK